MTDDPGPIARFEELAAKPETMGVLVQRIAEGETLKQLASAWKIPAGRLAQWLIEDTNRNELYLNAVALRETFRADEVHAIASEAKDKLGLGIAALRIKAIQWAAAKWNPARFGDRSTVDVAVKDSRTPLEREQAVLELARGMAYVLQVAGQAAERQRERVLLTAPIEHASTSAGEPPI